MVVLEVSAGCKQAEYLATRARAQPSLSFGVRPQAQHRVREL